MARVVMKSGWGQRLLAERGVRGGIKDVAEKIQDRAVEINVAEAVDTGLMAASWRVTEVPNGPSYLMRVHNTARSRPRSGDPGGANYPYFLEVGTRHMRAYHIALRSIDAART